MASEPTTIEELKAEVAALRAELARTAPSPLTPEVKGVAPPTQPDRKTSQAQGIAGIAVAPELLLRRRAGSKATPDQILAQIAQLQTVIVSGVNSAGYGDKRTEFRSLTELRQILDGLKDDLEAALGLGGRMRQIRMTTQADKGL
jgi:hypothetical protein